MTKFLLILLLIITSYSFVLSQNENIEILNNSLAYSEDFGIAIEMYKKLIMFDVESPVFYYKLGFCYLNTAGKEDSALIFLKKASDIYAVNPKEEISSFEINFYLAKSYRLNHNNDSAIIVLENLKKEIVDEKYTILIKNEISFAEQGLDSYGNGIKINIKNLGNSINSSYSEHSPVISEDKTVLMYTSRKKSGVDDVLLEDGQYDEDIYISKKIDGLWTEPELISNNINSNENEATLGLSPDGKTLFIYKSEKNGSIYYSKAKNDEWTSPIKLEGYINTRNRETHASIVRDEKLLFFTSDRAGGYGGLDIYISEIQQDGTWGKPINLGSAVNTEFDEDGPNINPDGNVLYFSSKGHQGYGGFDIYKSTKNEFGTWTLAENLGYPINSIEDDAFYCQITDKSAFFTSRKEDGYGQMDIYLLTLDSAKEDSLTVMTADIKGCENKVILTSVNIKDNTTGKKYSAKPNQAGKFVFVTYKGNNYNLTVTYENNDIFYDNFDIPIDSEFITNYKTIDLTELLSCDN